MNRPSKQNPASFAQGTRVQLRKDHWTGFGTRGGVVEGSTGSFANHSHRTYVRFDDGTYVDVDTRALEPERKSNPMKNPRGFLSYTVTFSPLGDADRATVKRAVERWGGKLRGNTATFPNAADAAQAVQMAKAYGIEARKANPGTLAERVQSERSANAAVKIAMDIRRDWYDYEDNPQALRGPLAVLDQAVKEARATFPGAAWTGTKGPALKQKISNAAAVLKDARALVKRGRKANSAKRNPVSLTDMAKQIGEATAWDYSFEPTTDYAMIDDNCNTSISFEDGTAEVVNLDTGDYKEVKPNVAAIVRALRKLSPV